MFENEPQVEPDLLRMGNVVLAPHIGSGCIDEIEDVYDGSGESACLAEGSARRIHDPEVWNRRRD